MLTPEQAAIRNQGIGASDAPYVLARPLDVYLVKVGERAFPSTPEMEAGNFLEGAVANLAAHRLGVTLSNIGTLQHREHPWMFAHLDRWIDEWRCPLEIKVVGPHRLADWGEGGTDQIPERVAWQCVHQMAVADAPTCRVAMCCGTDVRIYEFRRDLDLERYLIEQERAFWFDHVLPRVRPSAEGSRAAMDWLAERFPEERAPLRKASTDEEALALQFNAAKTRREKAEEQEKEARLRLCEAIGEAEGFHTNRVRATWRVNKAGSRTLRVSVKEIS